MTERTFTIPPYGRMTLRTDCPFVVRQGEDILGPNSESDRVMRISAANDALEVVVKTKHGGTVSTRIELRPNRYESNSGIPAEVQAPVSEPTIQDMIRMYLAEANHGIDDTPETPEEFFDFGDDDQDETKLSHYQLIDEQIPVPPQGDSPESPPEPESDQQPSEPTGSEQPPEDPVAATG